MHAHLPMLIFVAGVGQLGVLVASALVPIRLKWKTDLAVLTRLHRQLFWVYGGYVVLAIVSFGLICLFNAAELASGSGLARSRLRLHRRLLGNSPQFAGCAGREGAPDRLVAQAWLSHVDHSLRRLCVPLWLCGSLAVMSRPWANHRPQGARLREPRRGNRPER